jgi:serine protease inhibitor
MYGKIVSGSGHSPSELLFANGLFVQQGLKLNGNFMGIARSNYNSDVVRVNFQNEPEDAQTVINK